MLFELDDEDLFRAVDITGAALRRLADWEVIVPIDADQRRRGKKRFWPMKTAAVAARISALTSGGLTLGQAAGILLAGHLERVPSEPSPVGSGGEESDMNRSLAIEPEDMEPEIKDRRIRVLDGNFVYDIRHGSKPQLFAQIGLGEGVVTESLGDRQPFIDAGVPLTLGRLTIERTVIPERQRIAVTEINIDLPVRIAYRRVLKARGYVRVPSERFLNG